MAIRSFRRQVDTGDYDASMGFGKLSPYATRPRNPNQLNNRQALRNLGLSVPLLGTWFDALFGESMAPKKSYPRSSKPRNVGSGIQGGLGLGSSGRKMSPEQAAKLFKALNPFQGIMDIAQTLGQQNQPGGPGHDLLGELGSLQDPSRYMVDEGDLRRQARAAAAAQYNPVIRELLQEQRTSKSRYKNQSGDLKDMYEALAQSEEAAIPRVKMFHRQAKTQTKKYGADLRKGIEQDYDEIAQEQEKMLKQLNIEAAGEEATREQRRDKAFLKGQARTDEAADLRNLETLQRTDVGFQRQGEFIARQEGTNRRADLLDELNDVLGAYQSKISANRAARSHAETAAFGELQGQSEQKALQRSQQDFENYIKSFQLQQGLGQQEFDNWLDLQKLQGQSQQNMAGSDPAKYLSQVPDRLAYLGQGTGISQQNITNVYDLLRKSSALRNTSDPYARIKYPTATIIDNLMRETSGVAGLGPIQKKLLEQVAVELLGGYR